jgi:hypothetical protein
MEEEEWRPVQDYPDYQVSNLGRVKSTKVCRGIHERILTPSASRGGYLVVCLSNENGRKMFTTYRLVAIAFIPNPDSKTDVDHINRDRTDNQVSNLRWATRTENSMNMNILGRNTSGFRGVSFRKDIRKWEAYIGVKGTRIHLGNFYTPEEAHAVYLAKARELYGEFFNPD